MMDRSEREKMLAGELYYSWDDELVALRHETRGLLAKYNATDADQGYDRLALLQQLLGSVGEGIYIEPPFSCDYGSNISIGERFYANFGCVILDCAPVEIGNNVLFAPYVQIYTATHPTDPKVRLTGAELAAPITIGNNIWIGGGAIVLPGVTIGDNTVVGAGSVVTKSLPPNVVAAGNPCRVIRELA